MVGDAANKIIQEHLPLNTERLTEEAAVDMLRLAFGSEALPDEAAAGMHASFAKAAGTDEQIGVDLLPALFARTQVGRPPHLFKMAASEWSSLLHSPCPHEALASVF